MTVDDLFKELSYGVLSNLAIGSDGVGSVKTADQPKLLLYANEALLKLYGRFVLKEQDVMVTMFRHITFYHLLPRFALNYEPRGEAENEPIRYIQDLPSEKFEGDVLRILAVFNSKGQQYYLNDDRQPGSLFTPQANTLQVPHPIHGESLSVLYQAKHPTLTGTTDEIWVPDILLEALRSYIAYKVFSHMNTRDSTAKAQEHLGFYEASCKSVEEMDLVSSSISTTNSRFHSKGWV